MSATNAPVSVHISYQCSIGPDSPIYDVAHTPAPKPMARKVTKRRPQDLLPPTPPASDHGRKSIASYDVGATPAPSPRGSPNSSLRGATRPFPFNEPVSRPHKTGADPSIEGVDQLRRRWAAAAAAAARARVQQKAPKEFKISASSHPHRRSQSARELEELQGQGGPIQRCLADPYEGVDSAARIRRRRNLARKGGLGGSAHGMARRPGHAPVPRPRTILSVPGKAQPEAFRLLSEDDVEDAYMNLATARQDRSGSDYSGGMSPRASAGDVSSAAMGFSVCDDSGYYGDLVEDLHGHFQTTIDIDDVTSDVGGLPAPAWDAPLPPAAPFVDRDSLLARTKTVDSGYGEDDAELSNGNGDGSPDSDARAPIPMSLRSKNAGRSMVRRLGCLMGELSGELQSVRVARDSSDVDVDA